MEVLNIETNNIFNHHNHCFHTLLFVIIVIYEFISVIR
jgi:hypothetical protein